MSSKVYWSVCGHRPKREPYLMRSDRKITGARHTWSAADRAFCVSGLLLDDGAASAQPRNRVERGDGFWRNGIARQVCIDSAQKDFELEGCSTTQDDALRPWLREAEGAKRTLHRVGFAPPVNRSPRGSSSVDNLEKP